MKPQLAALSSSIKQMLYPKGSIATIRLGQLRGYRFMVTDNSGWSPIVGRWEPGAQLLYSKIIEKGQTVFDLGANAGLHSMMFSALVGETGSVYAFEPVADNCQEVRKCIELNSLRNVTVVESAVGAVSGQAQFEMTDHAKEGRLISIAGANTGKVVTVDVVTIDGFVHQRGVAPDFIKFDIEGAEGPALLGARDTLERQQPLLSIELHTPEQDVLVGTTLNELGYIVYRFDPASPSLPKLEHIKSPTRGWPVKDGTWGTILALPQARRALADKLIVAQ